MALDFPSPPGQPGTVYNGPNSSWQWDGAKWGAAGTASYLPLAGGTMLGSLLLYGNAGAPMEAVTLQQLQSTVGGSGFLPLTGGTLNPGPLIVTTGAQAARALTLRGDTTGSLGETAIDSGAIALRLGYASAAGTVRVAVTGQENVNAIEIKALSGAPVIFASGSAADVDLAIQGRGASGVLLGSTTNFQNKVRVVGAAAGNDPSISAFGSDTNIDLFLQGKGTGSVQIQKTTNLFTPKGNFMLGMPEPASMSTATGIDGGSIRAWYMTANNYMMSMYYDGTNFRRLNTQVPSQLSAGGGSLVFQTAAAGAADSTIPTLTTRAVVTYDGSLGIGGFTPTAGISGLISSQNSVVGNAMGINLYYDNTNWRARNAGTSGMWYMDTGGANSTMYLYLAANIAAGAVATIVNTLYISPTTLNMAGNINATGYINAAGQDANHYGLTTPNGVWSNGTSWFNLATGNQCTFTNVYANGYLYGAGNGRVDGTWIANGGVLLAYNVSNPCVSGYNTTAGRGGGFWMDSGGTLVFGQTDSNGYAYSRWFYTTNQGIVYCDNGFRTLINGNGFSVGGYWVGNPGAGNQYFGTNGLYANPNWGDCWIQTLHFPGVYAGWRITATGTYWEFRNDWNLIRGDGYSAAWNAISDIRIKKNIAPTRVDALDIICRLPISEFDIHAAVADLSVVPDMNGHRDAIVDDVHVELGWVAQMVGAILPRMEKVIMINDTRDGVLPQDTHIVDGLAVIPYMIRAIQQLTDRLALVEARP